MADDDDEPMEIADEDIDPSEDHREDVMQMRELAERALRQGDSEGGKFYLPLDLFPPEQLSAFH